MIVDLVAGILISGFCVQHSFFASNKAKSLMPISQQNYRLFYNVVGGITLVLLTLILTILSADPEHIEINPIIPKTEIIQNITFILSIIGLIFIIGSVVQTNPLKFAGLLAEEPDKDLQTGLFYRFSRHPMYTGAILLLGPNIFTSSNFIWFLQNFIFVVYFIIGSLYEEKRLKQILPGYETMFTRGHLFPWKKQHFITLFK
jgi:protein-S-isoprenylcysteine O-methyltransferase Ste14